MGDADRLHIIDGPLLALDRMVDVNDAVSSSPTRDDARAALTVRLGVSTAHRLRSATVSP